MNYYQLNNLAVQQEAIDVLIPSSMIIFTPPSITSILAAKASNAIGGIFQSSQAVEGSAEKNRLINATKMQNSINSLVHNNSMQSKQKIPSQKSSTLEYTWDNVSINHYNSKTKELFEIKNTDELKIKLGEIISLESNDSFTIQSKIHDTSKIYMEQKQISILEDIQQVMKSMDQYNSSRQRSKSVDQSKDAVDLQIISVQESKRCFSIKNQFYLSKYALCKWKGQPAILVLLSNDSTERRNQQLEQMNMYKDKLLATVSHDLKTPLNSIISITDYLQNDINQSSSTTIGSEEQNSPVANGNNQSTFSSTLEVPQSNQLLGSTKPNLKSNNTLYKKSFKTFKTEEYEYKLSNVSHQKYLKMIFTNSMMLLSMINDILDYSQLNYSNTKMKVNVQRLDLVDLIQEVFDIFQFQSTAKNLQMICSNSENKSCINIWSDRNRLKQILMNFVSNSLKFTLEGYVKVFISILPQTKDKIGITVEDSGVGMPSYIKAKLFNEFGTFNQQNLNSNGIGLGLMICKKLIGIMGDNDSVEVKSEEGKGTQFYFEISTDMRDSFSLNLEEDQNIKQLPIDMQTSIGNVIQTSSPMSKLLKTEIQELCTESQEQLNKLILPSIVPSELNNQFEVSQAISTHSQCDKHKFNFEEQLTLEYIDQKQQMNQSNTKASIFLREINQLQKENNLQLQLTKDNNCNAKRIRAKEKSERGLVRVMIVDDSQFNIFSLKVNLRDFQNKIVVDEFLDPRKALEAIQSQPYDVVITDIQMPIINGIQLVTQIRELRDSIAQPLTVLISAGNEGYYEKEIQNLNIFSFINKPIVDKKQFKELINRLIKQTKNNSQKIC